MKMSENRPYCTYKVTLQGGDVYEFYTNSLNNVFMLLDEISEVHVLKHFKKKYRIVDLVMYCKLPRNPPALGKSGYMRDGF